MAELIVVGFEGTHRAAEVLDQLQRLNADAVVDLKDAVAVYRTRRGRLRTDRSMHLTTKEEAGWGAAGGGVVAALLALPLAAAVAGPVAAAALGIGTTVIGAAGGAVVGFDEAVTWRESYGISDEFVKRVSGMIQPGQSAIFVLANTANPDAVVGRFRGHGGTILRTTLSAEHAKALAETLAVQGTADPRRTA